MKQVAVRWTALGNPVRDNGTPLRGVSLSVPHTRGLVLALSLSVPRVPAAQAGQVHSPQRVTIRLATRDSAALAKAFFLASGSSEVVIPFW